MADKKVSELDAITGANTAADDLFLIVDSSGSVTKKITREELNNAIERDVLSTVNIDGGTIDGTTIGGTTAAAGTFTDLTATGTVTGITQATGNELENVVEDTTPQLGGNLDTNGNDINFGDNDKAQFGASNDLQIYHDGLNSYISEQGTGNLNVLGTSIDFLNSAANKYYMSMSDGGSLTLYHNGGSKLATTSSGIDVTGTVTADGLTVDASGGGLTFSGGGNTFISATSSPLIFQTSSGTERMRITGTGNVGIGTTGPVGKLHVVDGRSYFASNSNAFATYLRYNNSTAGVFVGSPAANEFQISNSGGAARFNIDSSGNVGIGTTNPSQEMHLYAGSGATDLLIEQGSTGNAYLHTKNSNREYVVGTGGDALKFIDLTADTERMRITSGGNVGIGTTSPTSLLDVNGQTQISGRILTGQGAVGSSGYGFAGDGNTCMFSSANNTLQFGTSGSERMRITSTGNLLVGTTSTIAGATSLVFSGTEPAASFNISNATTSYKTVANICANGSANGAIQTNTLNQTRYTTSSDYRLKENVTDMTGAIDRVKALAPKQFSFISDPDSTLIDGFLAHEAQAVVPEAISGTHNEVDEDGNAVMQGIDQSKLVPLLTGALQEAIAKIENLETRIAVLEGA